MFGIGLPEFILIMGLALIVVGPDKLPGLAKTVAKQILELKKAANSLKESLDEELKEEKEALKEISAPLNDLGVSLPDFADMHGDQDESDSDRSVVDAVASPDVDVVACEERKADSETPIVEKEKL